MKSIKQKIESLGVKSLLWIIVVTLAAISGAYLVHASLSSGQPEAKEQTITENKPEQQQSQGSSGVISATTNINDQGLQSNQNIPQAISNQATSQTVVTETISCSEDSKKKALADEELSFNSQIAQIAVNRDMQVDELNQVKDQQLASFSQYYNEEIKKENETISKIRQQYSFLSGIDYLLSLQSDEARYRANPNWQILYQRYKSDIDERDRKITEANTAINTLRSEQKQKMTTLYSDLKLKVVEIYKQAEILEQQTKQTHESNEKDINNKCY